MIVPRQAPDAGIRQHSEARPIGGDGPPGGPRQDQPQAAGV